MSDLRATTAVMVGYLVKCSHDVSLDDVDVRTIDFEVQKEGKNEPSYADLPTAVKNELIKKGSALAAQYLGVSAEDLTFEVVNACQMVFTVEDLQVTRRISRMY